MRWLILAVLLSACMTSEEIAAENKPRAVTCQNTCRAMGAPVWSYALGGGHFHGCFCSGPVPEQVCPPHRPADGGSCP